MSVNILLADDHLMVREGLKQGLELDHDIDVIRINDTKSDRSKAKFWLPKKDVIEKVGQCQSVYAG